MSHGVHPDPQGLYYGPLARRGGLLRSDVLLAADRLRAYAAPCQWFVVMENRPSLWQDRRILGRHLFPCKETAMPVIPRTTVEEPLVHWPELGVCRVPYQVFMD